MESRAKIFSTGAASAMPEIDVGDKRTPWQKFDDWLWMEQ